MALAQQRAGDVELYKNEGKNSIYEKPVIVQKWSMLEQAGFFVDAVKDPEIAEDYIKKMFLL